MLVTYCPLCGTGMAFEPPQHTGGAGLGVSGLLYNSDVLLHARPTQSLCSQILSNAVSGPLKGTTMLSVPLMYTRWADWHYRYSEALAIRRIKAPEPSCRGTKQTAAPEPS